ncbi:hypothetical protein [Dongia sedimenti]|uniref:Uncharacterized protein n=1 Tax=Dongia sedimenti TaxID=3064282 RepID=A0ABU0YV91_9PROT|nr:hypothetical protein [Rhodospirillaceae bacterium R-7]
MIATILRPGSTAAAVATIADFMASGTGTADRIERFLTAAVSDPAGAEDWAAENWLWLPAGIGKAIRSRGAMAMLQGALDAMREQWPDSDQADERLAAAARLLRGLSAPQFQESVCAYADRITLAGVA